MTNFYQLSPERQAERLKVLALKAVRHWDQTANVTLQLVKHRENAVFRVTHNESGKRYALRIHRAGYHSDAALNSELQWMNALKESGILAPAVIPGVDGKLYQLVSADGVPEERQCDLLEWLDGKSIGTIEGDIEVDRVYENYRAIGRLAARLHNHAADWEIPQGFTRHAWDEDGLLGEEPLWGRFWELSALNEDQRRLIVEAREKAFGALEDIGKSKDVYGLLHADFVPENLLYCEDEIGLIDFDDSGFGWHLFDIATTLFFHLGESHYEDAYTGLIEGYRSVRDLPDSHLEKLPLFFLLRGFTYLGWAHTRSETETAKEFAPVWAELVSEMSAEFLGAQKGAL